MAFQKSFDLMVIGLVAKFDFNDAHNLPVMDRRIEMLQVENVSSDWFWVPDFPFLRRVPPLIGQA